MSDKQTTGTTRRRFLGWVAAGIAARQLGRFRVAAQENVGMETRPNILLITVDDMNYDSAGVVGCKVPEITPNIDRLAAEGIRFAHAHVTAAVCQPSRQCMMTGRYPHNNGAPGFDPIRTDVPTLQEHLHAAGYMNGILGKVGHLAPVEKFPWTTNVGPADLDRGRNPQRYYEETKAFIEQAKAEGKPFFLMANSHDPHRPFAGSDDELRKFGEHPPVSRTYRPEEIEVPGFLPDIPDVRKEVAQYFTSAHRCDDTVGEVLRALEESGQEDNTLVMFLSDNGMAFPFAKTNCYLASTGTPWIVRWPGKVRPRTVDHKHFISGIDYMPTILEAAGLPMVEGMDGRSFLPLLLGEEQEGRDSVFTVFNITAGRKSYPMRCVQNRRFGYIFNAWSDGETVFKNESQSGLSMNAMREAAEHEEAIAERVKLFLYRVPEEFYDFGNDPNALKNLIDSDQYKEEIDKLRREMRDIMRKSNDPLLPTFERLH
jgi:N-sulfoglucosamine sulfohydrolase